MEIEGEMVVPGTEFEEILSGGPEENGGGNYSKGDSEDDETLVPAKEVMKELEKSDLSSREDRAETEAPGENREAAEPTDVNGIDDNPTEPSESVDADPASEEGPASAEASKATESGTVKVETAATQSAEPADDAETPPSADQADEVSKEAPPQDAKSTADVDAEIPESEKASSTDYQALPQGNPSLNVVDHPTKNEDSDLGRTSSSSIPASTNAEKDEEESANAIHAEPASSEDKKEPAGPEEAEKPDVSPVVSTTQEVPGGEQEEAEDGPLEEEGSVEKTAAEVEALAQDSTTAPAEADIYTRGLNPEEERMLVESAIQSLLESVKSKVQEDAEMEENKSTNSKFEYSWTQNSAAVMIYIPIEAGVRAKDVTVDVSSEAGTINVKQRGRAPLLEGSLHSEVSENGLTWQIEGEDGTRAITIELEKAERKLWSMLVVGDQRDEQSPGQSTSRTSAPLDTELQATESDANEEIIELDVDKMQKANRAFADLEDGETGLEAWEEEELMRELEKEVLESAGEDRMGQDASMHSGEIPLADLLEYYKAIATGKANGVESVEMAAMQVALFYSKGIVVQQDFKEAAGWYEIAAKDKNDIAMFHLGLLYQEGLGVETDVQKAMDWWEKAADLGNANALYNLGVMYINGHGVQQDTYKAIDYFTKAKELDPSLPFPPFAEFGNSSSAPRESMPLTAEEKNQQRENSIQNLRYIFWTTTFVSVAAVTFFGVRYWWKNRL
uniref:CS domain-containing protein n=1 Tax=Rhodosorus marinus TaxID=101924 RepID=A0A7S0G7P8_9RHOD|mmetsp:Transcript_973/g.1538  ORF Transcript_973/g.1538 Transcript_973/m.1538 type:complete len:732 (+) Transcript_973:101-2296(+)